MTNERAIELLNRISDSQFDGPHGDERREALEMAVRALEQNLVQESGDLVKDLVKDCISRQQAIMAVKTGALSAATIFGRTDEGATAYYETVKAIKALPSAQPERKKGKWIILPPIFEEICQCSNCKMKFKDALQWTNYCPNCRADMRGESDE